MGKLHLLNLKQNLIVSAVISSEEAWVRNRGRKFSFEDKFVKYLNFIEVLELCGSTI